MYVRMKILKLRSMYIEPMGKHLDKKTNAQYEALKKYAHSRRSKAFHKVGDNEIKYKKTENVYIPYKEPKIKTAHFDDVITHPIKAEQRKKNVVDK